VRLGFIGKSSGGESKLPARSQQKRVRRSRLYCKGLLLK
jgi:hypothetical protein